MQSCDEPFVPSLFDDSLDGAANRFREKYLDFEAVRGFLEEMLDWHDSLLGDLRRFQEHPDLDLEAYPFEVFLAGIEWSYQELEDAILEASPPTASAVEASSD